MNVDNLPKIKNLNQAIKLSIQKWHDIVYEGEENIWEMCAICLHFEDTNPAANESSCAGCVIAKWDKECWMTDSVVHTSVCAGKPIEVLEMLCAIFYEEFPRGRL